MAKMKPSQLQTADEIARNIMEKSEWDMRSANNVLMQDEAAKGAWMLDLEQSRLQLEKEIAEQDAAIELLDQNNLASANQ